MCESSRLETSGRCVRSKCVNIFTGDVFMVQVSKVGPPPVESCDIDWISKSTLSLKPWALMDLTDAVKLMSLWGCECSLLVFAWLLHYLRQIIQLTTLKKRCKHVSVLWHFFCRCSFDVSTLPLQYVWVISLKQSLNAKSALGKGSERVQSSSQALQNLTVEHP